jgi:carboxyvinyl-carboxyphosphonate phosphorylmutase
MVQSTEIMRQILGARQTLKAAALSDPISAVIAEKAGFKVGLLLSSSATMAVLGAPDTSLISLPEMAEQTRRVARRSQIPILVDGEHGFGNALNAMRTVEEIEAAGASAVTIEDTILPRPFKAGASLEMITEEEGVAKMKAALLGRRSSTFMVLARTSALAIASLEEALRRVKNYEAAGVDGIFLSGVKSLEQLNAVRAAVAVPIVVGAIAPDLRSIELLSQAGVSVWAQGNLPLFDAVHAMYAAYSDILAGKREAPMQNTSSDLLVDEATRGSDYSKWLEAFC